MKLITAILKPFKLRVNTCIARKVFFAIVLGIVYQPANAQDDSWKAAMGNIADIAFDLREEIVSIPPWDKSPNTKMVHLTGTLYQPKGDGPHPVMILSHGSPSRSTDRQLLGRYRILPQIRALVNMGFAVLVPMRRGFGESTAEYAENIGYCQEPKYERVGEASSLDLRAAVQYVQTRPTLDAAKIVLIGQSAGGFASLAMASLELKGVVAVANFAGGRGGNGIDGIPCRPDLMAQVIATYAKTTRIPVLWLYAENDKYFGPTTAKMWFSAFELNGAKGKFIMHPPYGNDGHLLFYAKDAVPIWTMVLDSFFRETDLIFHSKTDHAQEKFTP